MDARRRACGRVRRPDGARFALIGLMVVALAAVAALAALAGAILATPYLFVRTLRRHLAERHQSMQGSLPIATAIAHADPS